MKIPAYVRDDFKNLLNRLTTLLAKAGSPPPEGKSIDSQQLSQDADIYSVQQYYNFIYLVLYNILPIVEKESNLASKAISIGLEVAPIKKCFEAMTIAGKWSYYAASDFASTMNELNQKFQSSKNKDDEDKERKESEESVDNIQWLFDNLKFNPESLVAKTAEKLIAYKKSVDTKQDVSKNYITLCRDLIEIDDRISNLNKYAETVGQGLKLLFYQPSITRSTDDRIKFIKALEDLELYRAGLSPLIQELNEKITSLAPRIDELPEQVLVTNEDTYSLETVPHVKFASMQTEIASIKTTISVYEENIKQQFDTIYQDIISDITPIEEKLKDMPSSKAYAAEQYAFLLDEFSKLNSINFSQAAKTASPHREDSAVRGEEVQKTFSDILNDKIAPIKQELEKQIKDQENLFNNALIQVLEQKKAAFEKICQGISTALNNRKVVIAEATESELEEEQKFYTAYDDQLKEQLDLKKMVSEWINSNNLSEDESTKNLLSFFLPVIAIKPSAHLLTHWQTP